MSNKQKKRSWLSKSEYIEGQTSGCYPFTGQNIQDIVSSIRARRRWIRSRKSDPLLKPRDFRTWESRNRLVRKRIKEGTNAK